MTNHLKDNPASGQGFIFINRKRTYLKCLYFEAGGYCLWCKRLEQGQFAALGSLREGKLSLSATEFSALVEGLDMVIKRRRKRYSACWVSPQKEPQKSGLIERFMVE